MFKGITIKFQHWVLLMTVVLVVFLSTALLVTVFRTFATIAEENASDRFGLIASRAANELKNLIQGSGRFVSAQARADLGNFTNQGKLNETELVPIFLESLKGDASIYSHFFGLANDEFLQVIGVRRFPMIIKSLQAPANTQYAVRRIVTTQQGRIDRYEFLDDDYAVVGRREQPATLVPTQRPWYASSIREDGLIVTDPYIFASNGQPGITVAAPLRTGAGALATDISLRLLQEFIAGLEVSENGAIVVQDKSGKVLALRGHGPGFAGLELEPLTPPERIVHPLLAGVMNTGASDERPVQNLTADNEPWVIKRLRLSTAGAAEFNITVLAPLTDFTGSFSKARRDVFALALLVLVILVPLAIVGSRQISRALVNMAQDSEYFKQLDFNHTPQKQNTFLYEVNTLGDAQMIMYEAIQKRTGALLAAQGKLENLVATGLEMGRERDQMEVLRKILFGGKELLNCDAGTLYLLTERRTLRFAMRTKSDELPSFEIPLYDEHGQPIEKFMATWCALHAEPLIVDDVYQETRFDTSGAKAMDAATGYRSVSMLTVPLSPRVGEVIGVMQFLNAIDPETGAVIPFPPELVRFVSAMAAQAAVALDNLQLLEAQEKLMEALIKLIAGSIDAKSPYTGGHCERVPELAMMLAEAASAVHEGSLAPFQFTTEAEWREFRIGAWLHDCGKVTTPEYVVDKASKLETIYNRIHEVRTRFEVLLRDARIEVLERIAAGADASAAESDFTARKAQLLDDFAFVAECNLGGEFMAPEKIERLQRIAAHTWVRHFDDRLGLPDVELKRYPATHEPLPVTEHLLADKPHHVIPRIDTRSIDPKWGFKVNVPQNLYNYGEVYNLAIRRGTLTEEERFKINEHVMQSLMMLEQLPLPKTMKRVPEYAGTHHETLIGTGYPRKLDASALSIPTRIMAIADIFEALTASDRPYKKAKTLAESVKILAHFKNDQHIDAELFDLFLSSGVYKKYADKYLLPEQIDEVDVAQYLTPLAARQHTPQETRVAQES